MQMQIPGTLDDYRKLVVPIIEEYFSTGDVELAASELRGLGSDQFQHYFVKKLISMAMDRHDKEKEMASILLSSLYADLLSSYTISEDFMMLLESTEDLTVDIPDATDVLQFLLHGLLLMKFYLLFSSLELEHYFQNFPKAFKFCRLFKRAICQLPTMQSWSNANGVEAHTLL